MKIRSFTAGICAGLLAASFVSAMPAAEAAFESPILNGDFESGKTVGWDIAGDRCVDIATKNGDCQGTAAMHYWSDKAFKFTAQQEVTDVPDGVYNISVMTQGGGGENSVKLFADVGGQRKEATIANTGWNKWQTWTIENVEIKGGKFILGVAVDANAGNWGSFDNFDMVPVK